MLRSIYAIKDIKTNHFSALIIAVNNDEMDRMFGELCTDLNSELYKYADDKVLYWLGEYNIHTGEITAGDPTRIMSAQDKITEMVSISKLRQAAANDIIAINNGDHAN